MVNLETAFNRGLAAHDTPRGDEVDAHVSDIGRCLFATWARRNGEPVVQKSPKTRARLQAGLRDEAWIVDRIASGLDPADGWWVVRSGELTEASDLVGHFDVVLTRKKCRYCPEWLGAFSDLWRCANPHCESDEFQGLATLDDVGDVERCVFDVKTTEWKEEWVETGEIWEDTGKPKKQRQRVPWPDAPGDLALLQVYGYAKRLPLNPDGTCIPYGIFQWCRASLQGRLFGWYSQSENAQTFKRIAKKHDDHVLEVLAKTAPGSDPVVNEIAFLTSSGSLAGFPQANWECAYCWNAMCKKNVNPDNAVIPV